ncbi:MAG: hypothetical protein HUU50_00650 [Candidatus Brocadiae bacterium]|nr:hypothetical protein [Candidatus Brocadiia bacterium]
MSQDKQNQLYMVGWRIEANKLLDIIKTKDDHQQSINKWEWDWMYLEYYGSVVLDNFASGCSHWQKTPIKRLYRGRVWNCIAELRWRRYAESQGEDRFMVVLLSEDKDWIDSMTKHVGIICKEANPKISTVAPCMTQFQNISLWGETKVPSQDGYLNFHHSGLHREFCYPKEMGKDNGKEVAVCVKTYYKNDRPVAFRFCGPQKTIEKKLGERDDLFITV